MAVVRHAEAEGLARRARVLDLADVRAEAERIVAEARAQAEGIVREAHDERARLIADAEETGRAAGHAEGLERGREQGRQEGAARAAEQMSARLAELDRGLAGALEEFVSGRRELLDQARDDVVRLALAIASRVVKRTIESDPSIVADQAAAALQHVVGGGRVRVCVHPDDEGVVRDVLPELRARVEADAGIELSADESVERGGCVVRTQRGGAIDATISTQLERIVRAVLPDAESGTSGPRLRFDEEAA